MWGSVPKTRNEAKAGAQVGGGGPRCPQAGSGVGEGGGPGRVRHPGLWAIRATGLPGRSARPFGRDGRDARFRVPREPCGPLPAARWLASRDRAELPAGAAEGRACVSVCGSRRGTRREVSGRPGSAGAGAEARGEQVGGPRGPSSPEPGRAAAVGWGGWPVRRGRAGPAFVRPAPPPRASHPPGRSFVAGARPPGLGDVRYR